MTRGRLLGMGEFRHRGRLLRRHEICWPESIFQQGATFVGETISWHLTEAWKSITR